MSARFFFLNEATGKRYDVVNIDRTAGTIQLRGPTTQRVFTEKLDNERFARMGYKLMKEEDACS